MGSITISTENRETYSAISNFFIDYYMTEANGEFVKVYLYLVRLLNSGRAFTIADIADHFNLTEKDICRAIRYWIKEEALRLEYTKDKVLTGITMLPLKSKNELENPDSALLSMLGVEDVEDKPTPTPNNVYQMPTASNSADTDPEDEMMKPPVEIPKKKAYKPSFIEDKQKDEDFGNVLYQTEIYFGRPLTQTDINSLLYIYTDLHFTPDLLEYLIEHCVSIGKKSCRYIESVAIDWYKNDIKTVEAAKVASKNYNSIYVTVLKQLGIPRRVPTPTETSFIDTWYNTYSFDKNIILEACKRAVIAKPQSANFNYVNGILESWHKKNVHKLSDIEKLDEEWAAEKKKGHSRGNVVSSNQFNNYHNSTSAEVINEFEQLFLQETNQ